MPQWLMGEYKQGFILVFSSYFLKETKGNESVISS